MTRRRSSTDTWEPLVHVRRWNSTAFVDVTFGRRWDGTQWIEWWPIVVGGNDFQAVPSSSEAVGTYSCVQAFPEVNNCPFANTVVTDAVTITPQGGTGTPSYAWAYVSGDSGITVSNATAATVTFSGVVSRNDTRTAVWRCTVTRGSQTASTLVTVNLSYEYTRANEEPF